MSLLDIVLAQADEHLAYMVMLILTSDTFVTSCARTLPQIPDTDEGALHACCCRRERTPPEVRLVREKEKELAALERATRTIFTYNLHPKATERDIFEFFSKVRVAEQLSVCHATAPDRAAAPYNAPTSTNPCTLSRTIAGDAAGQAVHVSSVITQSTAASAIPTASSLPMR